MRPRNSGFDGWPAEEALLRHIDAALAEDVGSGDATTLSTVDEDVRAEAEIVAREPGVIAGLPVAERVFVRVDPELDFTAQVGEGDRVATGVVVARIAGRARGILTAERTALNYLQHLSGIATRTRRLVDLLEGTGTRVLDTRKTVPGMRALAKYAVSVGGGENHRRGLDDMVLIKENHIRAAGGISAAVTAARGDYPHLSLEVEVTDLTELAEALENGPDRVMLDNFTPDRIPEALALLEARFPEPADRPKVEVSGGITEATVRDLAGPGIDFVSSGALTHSAAALDLALEIRLLPGTDAPR